MASGGIDRQHRIGAHRLIGQVREDVVDVALGSLDVWHFTLFPL